MWAQNKKYHTKQGFTIVELLIVIVVVAILAAIVIVAFASVQARASFSKEQTDLKNIVTALELYHVDHAAYPSTTGQSGCTYNWCGWDQVAGDAFITGLSPQYTATIPQMPTANASNDSYLYQSNGTDYELIRYRAAGLPAVEMQNNPLLATTDGYNGLAWGYRTNTDGHWW
jgi:prepilin-type N-terminal cleavage/methylation domain-containing protein